MKVGKKYYGFYQDQRRACVSSRSLFRNDF